MAYSKFRQIDVSKSLEVLKEKQLCFKCLESGNQARDCDKEVKCTKDGGGENITRWFMAYPEYS